MQTYISSDPNKYQEKVILLFLFSLAAIWNIPNTIAARYICEGVLISLLLTCKINWIEALKKLKILIVFFIYLFIQLLFFSSDLNVSLKNFKSEWMHFLIFSIIGVGSGIVLSKSEKNNILLMLGIAFALPLFLHLILSFLKGFTTQQIPWGYWGLSQIHGDLAYSSLQASILLMAYLLCQKKTQTQLIIASSTLVVCIISPLLAQSRGGLLFTLIIIFVSIVLYILTTKSFRAKQSHLFYLTAISLLIGSSSIAISIQYDSTRWSNLFLKAHVGFLGDANSVFCQGIDSIEKSIIQKKGAIGENDRKALNSILDGDAARIMAARSGYELIFQNLMGINGSKEAYQLAITKFCNAAPKIFISHTHNAWIDTSLAIGLIGALFLLIYFLILIIFGFRHRVQNNVINPFAFALLVSAFIWLLRGMLDSTLRDQMLEIQAFVLPFLFFLSIRFIKK